MHNPVTVEDALALLRNSSLPTVLTEGSDDYRVMRKIEERMADIGVSLLPLHGRPKVLEVWQKLPDERKDNTCALVDLDDWVYFGIPDEYVGNNLFYTVGYSIENDLLMDFDMLNMLEPAELVKFTQEKALICTAHARILLGSNINEELLLSSHPNKILSVDLNDPLNDAEQSLRNTLSCYYLQMLRGKTVFELLVSQLSRRGRFAKFGYKQLYELSSSQTGPIFKNLERNLRIAFSDGRN